MTIHYENHGVKGFSKGQGFIGAMCRPINPMAKTARWKACDCRECKNRIIGRHVISRHGQVGHVAKVGTMSVEISMTESDISSAIEITWDDFDDNWAPLPDMEELFGVSE